jgi:hypothetical protein
VDTIFRLGERDTKTEDGVHAWRETVVLDAVHGLSVNASEVSDLLLGQACFHSVFVEPGCQFFLSSFHRPSLGILVGFLWY